MCIYIFHYSIVHSFLQTANFLFSGQANITSMKKLPSINDTKIYFLKFFWLETLCTLRIMKCLKTFPRLNNFNSLLAVCRIRILGVEKSLRKFS